MKGDGKGLRSVEEPQLEDDKDQQEEVSDQWWMGGVGFCGHLVAPPAPNYTHSNSFEAIADEEEKEEGDDCPDLCGCSWGKLLDTISRRRRNTWSVVRRPDRGS